MMRRYGWLLVALALFAAWQWWRAARPPGPGAAPAVVTPDARPLPGTRDAALPREAYDTLQRIHAGGPFPHRQDGGVFQNRERQLPQRARGWYREYTVQTPGSRDRGARRIVTGGGAPGLSPPSEYWYTQDHYRSFRRIDGAAERRP